MNREEELINEARETFKQIKAPPEMEETFIMGFIHGRLDDLDKCKESFPEYDWDSSRFRVVVFMLDIILGRNMK